MRCMNEDQINSFDDLPKPHPFVYYMYDLVDVATRNRHNYVYNVKLHISLSFSHSLCHDMSRCANVTLPLTCEPDLKKNISMERHLTVILIRFHCSLPRQFCVYPLQINTKYRLHCTMWNNNNKFFLYQNNAFASTSTSTSTSTTVTINLNVNFGIIFALFRQANKWNEDE